jgi:hypothetical protein
LFARSTSHPVGVGDGCTNIPLAAGRLGWTRPFCRTAFHGDTHAGLEPLPDVIDALKAALVVARAEAAAARAQQSDDQALIAFMNLMES